MTIEQLWLELEAEASAGSTATWSMRLASPNVGQPLLVALEKPAGIRSLLLPVPKKALPARRDWPECRGLELFMLAIEGQPHLGVKLRDPNCADVFTALAEDVSPRVVTAPDIRQAITALLDRLRHWQHFLAAGHDGLGPEAQRGLWGELHVLRAHLVPALGPTAAVEGWKAPAATNQDFQFSTGSIEVKTTSAKQPQAVRITSERQLDDTGTGTLLLHVVIVDEREVPPGGTAPGTSLPEMITALRAALAENASAIDQFNDRLLETGWLDVQAQRYETRRWALRKELVFMVQPGFPRLVESALPTGVGSVSYDLSLAACEPFATGIADAVALLAEASNTPGQSSNQPE